MQEITLKNWTHFLEIAETLDVGPAGTAQFLCRGQAKASWDLSPSLLRQFPKSITAGHALVIEADLLQHFTDQVHLHLPPEQVPKVNDPFANWALMQHYGAPTRLLDWTASPFVAAYSAVLGHWDEPGAIWLIHARSVDSSVHDESLRLTNPLPVLVPRFIDPGAAPHLIPLKQIIPTHRAVAQQGWFTVSTQILAEHSEILENVKPQSEGSSPPAIKLIVPTDCKPTFLRRLRTMNVTANALFPGADGLGRSIAELASIRAHEAAHQAEGEGQAEPKDAPTDTEVGESSSDLPPTGDDGWS